MGGATRMPAIRRFVRNMTGLDPAEFVVDPDLVGWLHTHPPTKPCSPHSVGALPARAALCSSAPMVARCAACCLLALAWLQPCLRLC